MTDHALPVANYRVDYRYPPQQGVKVACRRRGADDTGPDLALFPVDFTDIGTGLAVREPVEKGQAVEVELLAPGWPGPVRRLGQIVWCEEAGGAWRVGVVFTTGLCFEELQALCRILGPHP